MKRCLLCIFILLLFLSFCGCMNASQAEPFAHTYKVTQLLAGEAPADVSMVKLDSSKTLYLLDLSICSGK